MFAMSMVSALKKRKITRKGNITVAIASGSPEVGNGIVSSVTGFARKRSKTESHQRARFSGVSRSRKGLGPLGDAGLGSQRLSGVGFAARHCAVTAFAQVFEAALSAFGDLRPLFKPFPQVLAAG